MAAAFKRGDGRVSNAVTMIGHFDAMLLVALKRHCRSEVWRRSGADLFTGDRNNKGDNRQRNGGRHKSKIHDSASSIERAAKAAAGVAPQSPRNVQVPTRSAISFNKLNPERHPERRDFLGDGRCLLFLSVTGWPSIASA